jgi:hypothetical protein
MVKIHCLPVAIPKVSTESKRKGENERTYRVDLFHVLPVETVGSSENILAGLTEQRHIISGVLERRVFGRLCFVRAVWLLLFVAVLLLLFILLRKVGFR